jgi:CHAT domain-containing protein
MTDPLKYDRVASELVKLIREHPNPEDAEIIFQFLGQHLDYLDLHLIHALTKIFRKSLTTELAELYLRLGFRFLFFPFGEQNNSIEVSIACYKLVLEIYTKESFPTDWEKTQYGLANAYNRRIEGEQAENLEKSISCYEAVLKVVSRTDLPLLGDIQSNLGNAYSNRIKGNRAENLELAIVGYQAALEAYTQTDFPIDWAMTQHNLALAYWKRIKGNRAENLELSIAGCKAALVIRTQADFPIDWAMTQSNLGNAYSNRIKGNRAENLELAIVGYQAALEVYTQTDFPIDWAMTQHNLALAYWKRIKGNRAENLERAIEGYQSALAVRTQADFPIDWAMTQHSLAAAYSDRIRGDRAENLERAIGYAQAALAVRTQADFPIDWAMTQNTLAIAYRGRIKGDRAENLELSIGSYQSALVVYTQTDFPIDWATTQNNLATTYEDRAENLELSIEGYQAALAVITPHNMPIDCLRTARNLGNLHFRQGNWQQAIDAYLIAISAVEQSRTWATSDQSKQEIIEKAIKVYFNLVQSCINTQQFDKAIEYAERSKSRNLVELLATRDLYPKGNIPPDILSQLDTLRRQVLSEERRLNQRRDSGNSNGLPSATAIDPNTPDSRSITNPNTPGIDLDRERLNTLKQDLDRLVTTHVRPIDPSFQLTQQVQPIDFATIQNALPNPQSAIVAWYISSDQIHTFIVTPHQNQPHCITSTPKQYEALDLLRQIYLVTYRDKKDEWRETLPKMLQQLAQILNLSEIVTQLQQLSPNCDRLILIPHRILHLLPLHALPLNETGECLLDLFPQGVRYAPSIQLLNLAQQWQRPPLQHLFAVQNPTADLKFTDVEVSKQFHPHVEVIKHEHADKTALNSERLSQANCAHFSCHGSFNFENPLASALLLSGSKLSQPPAETTEKSSRYLPTRDGGAIDLDNCLTLGEIFQLDLRQCRLVTLSACETGLTDFRSLGDEYIGLPSGFLYAGSSNVVSSLWAVSDLSTTFLMIKFYQNLQDTDSVAIALNQAQQWLRHITKAELLDWISQLSLGFAQKMLVESWTDTLKLVEDNTRLFHSPYHWAAFCAIG